MATIVLYKDKLNSVGGLINNIVTSSNGFNSQLISLKTTLQGVSSNTYDLQDAVDSISSSTKIEEEKVKDLKNLNREVSDFITTAVNRDNSARDEIDKAKEEFYTKYSYLKPECEKNILEKMADGFESVCDWCKENWESIVSIITVIVVVAAIVVASVLTFGTAAVVTAATVGAVVGIGCQLASDLVSFMLTGDWDASWQNYVGSALGGAVGGILMLTGNANLACIVNAGISTFTAGHLSNLTGGEKKSSLAILGDTVFSAGLTWGLGKILGKPVEKSKKALSNMFKDFTPIRRLAGSGNYDAAFRMVTTKLKNKQITAFHWKTIRNGIVSGMTGSYAENIVNGIIGAGKEKYSEGKSKNSVDISIDYSKFSSFDYSFAN